ncbi:MAG TPA: APC family permease [Nevskiaceae bacterium]|nr:APC family permease [Nevskiaceae bacterium]
MSSDASASTSDTVGDRRLKRHIGIIGLLFTAVGSIIGSGWLFGALLAAQQAGPASVVSWALGAVMILLIGLTYAELGTMFPVSGGVVRMPDYAFGSFASYTTGWITYFSCASVAAIEVEGALQYATKHVPWLENLQGGVPTLTTAGFFVACAMLGVFNLVNLLGIRWFARINNAAVWWKLGMILLVIVSFIAATQTTGTSHFVDSAHGGFAPLGWHGVFSAIATAGIVFSYLGFRQGVELAGETDNPQRNVPIAIIGSVLLCGVIYVLLEFAFIRSLPASALVDGWPNIGTAFGAGHNHVPMAFDPLAATAATLGMAWLATLLYIDAFISPADTGLIYSTVTARTAYAMARNGNAPPWFGRVNKRGVPWAGLITGFLVGCVFFLPFPGWKQLVGFVTSATVLSFGSGPLVMMALRRELPDYKRPFRLGGGWVIPYLAFLSSNLIVFWSGWDVVWKLMLLVVAGFVLLAIQESFWGEQTPKLDLRAGFWVVPWLAGLALISWLGGYPELSSHAGNLGYLDMDWGVIVIALFSVFIMWLAHRNRLPGPVALEHIHRVHGEPGAAQNS